MLGRVGEKLCGVFRGSLGSVSLSRKIKQNLTGYYTFNTREGGGQCGQFTLRYLFGHLARPLDDDGLGFTDRWRCVLIVIAEQAEDRVLGLVPAPVKKSFSSGT